MSLRDLALLDYGFIVDVMVESSNDNETYGIAATQEDFDRF